MKRFTPTAKLIESIVFLIAAIYMIADWMLYKINSAGKLDYIVLILFAIVFVDSLHSIITIKSYKRKYFPQRQIAMPIAQKYTMRRSGALINEKQIETEARVLQSMDNTKYANSLKILFAGTLLAFMFVPEKAYITVPCLAFLTMQLFKFVEYRVFPRLEKKLKGVGWFLTAMILVFVSTLAFLTYYLLSSDLVVSITLGAVTSLFPFLAYLRTRQFILKNKEIFLNKFREMNLIAAPESEVAERNSDVE